MKLLNIYNKLLTESILKSKSDKGNRYFEMLKTAKFQHYDSPKGELSTFTKGEDDRKRLVSKLSQEDKKKYKEWLKTDEGKESLKLFKKYETKFDNKVLKENINLLEYNKQDSFLSNYETAKKYAYDNIDGVSECFDDYNEDSDNPQCQYCYNNYIDLIYLYVDKYNSLKTKSEVKIYRMVKLNNIKNLDLKNIGKHWSFDINGVGAYGEQHPNRVEMKNGKPFILNGITNPKSIDWVYGFHSFIWYGEDQWECALLKGSKVVITQINDSILKTPINSIVGNH